MADDEKPPFDPNQPFESASTEKPPFDPTKPFEAAPAAADSVPPATGKVESAVQGAVAGATAGWSPELAGLNKASGLSKVTDYGGVYGSALSIPIGAARLAYEHLTGERGPATEEYEAARDALARRQEAMQKEHPWAYGGGELAGSIIPMAVAPEAEGTGLLARLAQGAKLGAGYGAASEAHTGFEKSGLPGAVEGAGLGAAEGAVGGAGGELGGTLLGKAGSWALDQFGKPITSAVRGWVNPEAEAARRVAGALTRDYPQVVEGTSLGMTPTQWAEAKAAGEPVTIADLGGETTRALMRSAANTSPEGRAALQSVIADRFAQQNDRAGATVRSLVSGGANTAKTKAQLEAEYELERGVAYGTAYEAGDRPIWSPELERLTSAPTVADAVRGAVNRWRDWQVKDGFGSMNPPVKITSDGQLQFTGGKGMLPYPNLQLWDYAARNLAGKAAEARRAGNNTEASLYGGLEQQLKAELDKQVPEFANARGVAAKFFGGNNVIEAAQEALRAAPRPGSKGDPYQIQRAMAGMKPAEREMFQEAYADALAAKLQSVVDNRDITNAMFNSPQERRKIGAVFGQSGVDKVQAFVNRERIYDAARKALGNSTTVRQMMEAGLAGGAVGAYLSGGDPRTTLESAIGAGSVGLAGGASGLMRHGLISGTKSVLGYVDRNTATRVAKLLASENPAELTAGLRSAARNKKIGDALGDIAAKASAAVGVLRRPKMPLMQLPGPTGAQDQQQGVPRPEGQQKDGGRIGEENAATQRAQGGTIPPDATAVPIIADPCAEPHDDIPEHQQESDWELGRSGTPAVSTNDPIGIKDADATSTPEHAIGGRVKRPESRETQRGESRETNRETQTTEQVTARGASSPPLPGKQKGLAELAAHAGGENAGREANTGLTHHPFHPHDIGARLARDGRYYLPDAKRPGKYLMVVNRGRSQLQ